MFINIFKFQCLNFTKGKCLSIVSTCNNTDFHLKPVILFKFQMGGHACNLYNVDVQHDKYNNVLCI